MTVPHKLPHTKTTITTPATLPGAAPIRRCPSCGIGYVMAGDPPVLAWEGACNRCGEVVQDGPRDELAPAPDAPRQPQVVCLRCAWPFTPERPDHVYCADCGRARQREASSAHPRPLRWVVCVEPGCDVRFQQRSAAHVRCALCALERRRQTYRNSYRRRRAGLTAGRKGVHHLSQRPVVCLDCGVEVPRTGNAQVRCVVCATEHRIQHDRTRPRRDTGPTGNHHSRNRNRGA